jgi:hypothetical protein
LPNRALTPHTTRSSITNEAGMSMTAITSACGPFTSMMRATVSRMNSRSNVKVSVRYGR